MAGSIYDIVPGLAKATAATADPPPGKVRVLRDLNLVEVSLCDDGANVGARIALFKRNGGADNMPVTIEKALDSARACKFGKGMREQYLSAFRQLQESVAKERGISESAALTIVAASSEGSDLYEAYKRSQAADPFAKAIEAGEAAQQELERIADAIVSKNPGVSRQYARGKAAAQNPQLAAQVQEAMRAGGQPRIR